MKNSAPLFIVTFLCQIAEMEKRLMVKDES